MAIHNHMTERERHVYEAAEFAKEVGGTDHDVKQWFFALNAAERRPILQAYGRRYGHLAQAYAEETFDAWKAGMRRMSGMVAKRLYTLLPPHMDVGERLGLVESLWRHHAPPKEATAVYGPTTAPTEVGAAVKTYFDQHASGHDIPSQFASRFHWLASNDAVIHQELLNRFLELDRARAATAAREVAAVIQQHLASGKRLDSFKHIVRVDGLAITLRCVPTATGVRVAKGRPCKYDQDKDAIAASRPPKTVDTSQTGGGFVIAIVIALFVLTIMLLAK